MSKYGITSANLLSTFPDVLKKDKKILALATVVADLLSKRPDEIDSIRIYPQIEKQPGELLDLLAYDLKVDWYGYDYDLDVKREQIKNSFKVHRTLGTTGAVEKALGSLYPGTEVQEWPDYGGNPFYFRVMLDVTNQQVAISHSELIRIINIFKSRRSHLQDSGIIYRSRAKIIVGVSGHYVAYSARLCGTFPVRATQGAITGSNIIILTDAEGMAYSAPMSGELKSGTFPSRAMQGEISESDILVLMDAEGETYSAPMSGEIVAGVHPGVATQGGLQESGIEVGAGGSGSAYSAPMCGTTPGSLM